MKLRIDKNTKWDLLLLEVYIALLHILYIHFFKDVFRLNYRGLLFVFDPNWNKYLVCLAETLVIFFFSTKKIRSESLAETAMLFLNLLYFLPGVVQQAVTNSEWKYMLFFFSFWVGMEFWLWVIRPRKGSFLGKFFRAENGYIYLLVLTAFAVVIAVFMDVYTGRYLTISNLVYTLNEIYEVRAAAKEQSIHWIIISFEYWAAYFCIIMITYFLSRKDYVASIILAITELALFVVQGNRIFLFLLIAAILIGLLKVNNRRIVCAFVLLAFLMMLEIIITKSSETITDMFRRYSVVPNRLGDRYFDFFQTNEPDLLRSQYDRITRLFGIRSPYSSPAIGLRIGRKYFLSEMNANSGLAAGGVFSFRYAGPVVSTLGYILSFRMFENVTYGMKNQKIVIVVAFVLASLAINMPEMLAAIFSPSYLLLLYLCMIPLSRASTGKAYGYRF